MLKYILKKIISFVISLLAMMTLTFFLMKILPGDPFLEEQFMRKDMHDQMLTHHHLDKSLGEQYLIYLKQILRGDLGLSLKYPGQSVNSMIQKSFVVSGSLGLQSLLIALTLGLLLGGLGSLYEGRWQNKGFTFLSILVLSIPSFLLASVLQYFFSIQCHLLPIARWGTWSQSVLPSISLAAAPAAFLAQLFKSELQEVLKTDYIKMAKSKGLPWTTIFFKHALPNALVPVLSYLGQLVGAILFGSFIIEKIFCIPGLGQWFVTSVSDRDYPLVLGLSLFYCFVLLVITLLVDLLNGWIDPRLRLKKEPES